MFFYFGLSCNVVFIKNHIAFFKTGRIGDSCSFTYCKV